MSGLQRACDVPANGERCHVVRREGHAITRVQGPIERFMAQPALTITTTSVTLQSSTSIAIRLQVTATVRCAHGWAPCTGHSATRAPSWGPTTGAGLPHTALPTVRCMHLYPSRRSTRIRVRASTMGRCSVRGQGVFGHAKSPTVPLFLAFGPGAYTIGLAGPAVRTDAWISGPCLAASRVARAHRRLSLAGGPVTAYANERVHASGNVLGSGRSEVSHTPQDSNLEHPVLETGALPIELGAYARRPREPPHLPPPSRAAVPDSNRREDRRTSQG